MGIKSAPCKDCPDRELGCHGKCKKYKEYQEANKKFREEQHKENEKTQLTHRHLKNLNRKRGRK